VDKFFMEAMRLSPSFGEKVSKAFAVEHALKMLRSAHKHYTAKCRQAYKSPAVKAARKAYRGYQAELERLMK
jgi:hypothetical protein